VTDVEWDFTSQLDATDIGPVPVAILRAIETFRESGKDMPKGHKGD